MARLLTASRVGVTGKSLGYVRYWEDFPYVSLANSWTDIGGIQSRADPKIYVVQTSATTVQRCLLMTTDPGDLVLDPTCGSGTTAYVAEQWGRRWITVDTSRVALALARQRIMGAKYPYYLLADSAAGQAKERSLGRTSPNVPDGAAPRGDVRRGFVCEQVPHVTLKSIANNPEIVEGMSREAVEAAIARHAETETLHDRPYEDAKRVRVSGRFTVESLSPHRSLSFGTDVSGEEAAQTDAPGGANGEVVETATVEAPGYERTILDNLRTAGVQNGRRGERLVFEDLEPYPGTTLQAVGTRAGAEGGTPQRVAVAIGPEYGTVSPAFIKAAAREALRGAGYDLLLVLGFSFDALSNETVAEFAPEASDFASVADERQMGRLPVLLVRMNADLAMGDELLKKTGAANLFTVFGQPDVTVEATDAGVVVEIRGVDVYDPTTGEVRVDEPDTVALWMVDTDYDGESFFVRHVYFAGGPQKGGPYERLRRSLKADVDEAAWESLYGTRSRPFPRPAGGRVAVKAINDYGDEVLTVLDVP